MAEENGRQRSPLQLIITILVVVIVPLIAGLYFAPRIVPKPQVGVVRLYYEIDGYTTYEITEQLAYAREHNDIKAVVLVINSPGGSAAYSEELFFDVLDTRAQLPVVASVDLLAASGAYYMAAAADEIYAKPTSSVGSIGVIALLPDGVYLDEDVLTTGPYKSFGGTRDGYVRQIERAKFAFLSAVRVGRGERLTVDDAFLSRAEIWTGIQALEFGLVDDLLSTEEAIKRAAEMAGLANYDVVELYPLAFNNGDTAQATYQPPMVDAHALWLPPTQSPPGMYYRYVDGTMINP